MHTRKFVSYEEIARHMRLLLIEMIGARKPSRSDIAICKERLGDVQSLLFSTFNTPLIDFTYE